MSLAMISPSLPDTSSTIKAQVQPAPKPVLQLVDVRKIFGDFAAVDGISVDIKEGEFVTIVGPSGSGKTTLLRMLAGMESPSEGYITLRGEVINSMPADKRPTCLVFQSLALFPHKTVGENIEFPLKVRKIPAAERKIRALEFMRMVRLPESYYSKNVMRCSGGEKQRISIARALLKNAPIIILDEPTAALDTESEVAVQQAIDALVQDKTVIVITHRLSTISGAQQIIVLSGGQVAESGTHSELLTQNGVYRRLWQAGG